MLNICICQLIKDEQRYIEEWIDFYLNLGVSKFILFEDWNSSSHVDVLSKYGDKVILHKLCDIATEEEMRNVKETRQEPIWKYFYEHYKKDFDVCLFVDVDEYLECNYTEFINEIETYNKDNNIQFITYTWQVMSANGHIKDPYSNHKYSLINTYTKKFNKQFKDLNINTKSLIFLNKLNSYTDFCAPHGPWEGDNLIKSDIRLRHYLTKSWEEYKYRIFFRGEPANRNWTRHIEDFFEINEDLLPYKEQLLKECENLEYKYNDYN